MFSAWEVTPSPTQVEDARFLNNRLRNRNSVLSDAVYQLLSNLACRIIHDSSPPQSRRAFSLTEHGNGPDGERGGAIWMSCRCRCLKVVGYLALQLGEVAVLARITLRSTLDKLEEVSQVFAFSGLEFRKLDADAERWTALDDNPGEDKSFDPDLPVSQPKTNFNVYTGRHRCGSLDEASANAGIG